MRTKTFSDTAMGIADFELAVGTLNLLATKELISHEEYLSVFDTAVERLQSGNPTADRLDAAELIALTRSSHYIEES